MVGNDVLSGYAGFDSADDSVIRDDGAADLDFRETSCGGIADILYQGWFSVAFRDMVWGVSGESLISTLYSNQSYNPL